MSERRTSLVESALHRVEEHIEAWRREDTDLKRAAEENRESLLSEATEREKKLAEELRDRRNSGGSGDTHTHVAFVVYSEGFAGTLENFSPERERLVKVVPARQSGGGMGVRGAWLVFKKAGG